MTLQGFGDYLLKNWDFVLVSFVFAFAFSMRLYRILFIGRS